MTIPTDQRDMTLVASQQSATFIPRNLPVSVVPAGFSPEGVEVTCVDPATLYLAEHALPPKYSGLLAHLLLYATRHPKTTMQLSLFHATGEANTEAILLISSVDALAKSPGSKWGAETYHKGLLVYESLAVIRRIFHRHYTEIRIPLGKREIHLPALFAALRRLHDEYENVKVKQLAKKVAKRLKSGEFAPSTVPSDSTTSKLRQVLTHLLQAHGVEEGHIMPMTLGQACAIIAQVMRPESAGRFLGKPGEFASPSNAHLPLTSTKKGESNCTAGESEESGDEEEGSSIVPAEAHMGELVGNESPEIPCLRRRQQKRQPKKGDVEAIFSMESPEITHIGSIGATEGDSVAGLSVSDHSPGNITHTEKKTLIDSDPTQQSYRDPRTIEEIQAEAGMYATLFDGEGNGRWMGKLIECIRATPPHIRRLAAISTLYYTYFPDYRGKPQRPGAWFAARCAEYANPDAKIPSPIRVWSETGKDYYEIQYTLQQGCRVPSEVHLPLMAKDVNQVPIKSEERQEVFAEPHSQVGSLRASQPPWKELQRSPQHAQLNTWMNQAAAEQLRHRIVQEGRSFGIKAVVRPGTKQGYVVVTTWDGVDEEMSNEAEWMRYFAEVQECLSM